jgi:hypothetical protein
VTRAEGERERERKTEKGGGESHRMTVFPTTLLPVLLFTLSSYR